jgi:hypothetical protein
MEGLDGAALIWISVMHINIYVCIVFVHLTITDGRLILKLPNEST